jgi:yeast amino acid transporter
VPSSEVRQLLILSTHANLATAFWRILIFYIGGVFVIGLVVPSTSDEIFQATQATTGAAASPFVVAATMLGVSGLNHVINA